MTHLRVPDTWSAAATRVADQIGHAAAAQVVGRGVRTIGRWATPTDPRLPSLDQALALDAAYLAAGGEDAPFLSAFAAQLNVRAKQVDACRQGLLEDTAAFVQEMGDAAAMSIQIAHRNASPSDVHRAVVEASEAVSAGSRLLRRLKSFLPQGAGPGAGKTGGIPT